MSRTTVRPDTPARRQPDEARERRRVLAIDVFRGFVLAFMIFTPPVANPAPMLGHAPWLGWTFADLVFPAFLVTSGASLSFLLRPPTDRARRLRLVRRTIALVVAGLLYNSVGGPLDLSTIRLTGVLQMIGVTGAIAAVAILALRRPDGTDRLRPLLVGTGALLVGYAVVLLVAPGDCLAPDGFCNPLHGLDEALLGPSHLYRGGSVAFDPEGIAPMLAATAFPVIGYLVGIRIQGARADGRMAARLAAAGLAVAMLGLAVSPILPLSKRLLTPSFVLFSGGIAVMGIGITMALFDARPTPRFDALVTRSRTLVAAPFVVLGWNALMVYLSERILLVAAAQTQVDGTSLQEWLFDRMPFSAGADAFAYSLLLLATILAIAWAMRLLDWRIAL